MESNEKKKILIICTGNSCRSQIAEGFSHEAGWQAYSAGTKPEADINPFAVQVMKELGIDISHHIPQPVNKYLDKNFYLVATLCNNAKETCPIFTGIYKHKIHNGFEDPADAIGSDIEITKVYRQLRDEIQVWVEKLGRDYLNN